MILNLDKFQEACSDILFAVDTKGATLFTETLELCVKDDNLVMNVTNRDYYCQVIFKDIEDIDSNFKAAVNAKLFLSLISKITSQTIELFVEDNYIKIKGNGDYKLPMIYNQGELLSLPTIDLVNITNDMTINSEILQSILVYNSKELLRGQQVKEVQKYYYIDEKGAVTFTSGACVNNFELEKPVKMLLNDKVVKLFKLFKNNSLVKFSMSQDSISSDLIQTKVKFESDNVSLTAKLPDTNLISSVPVDAIRSMATKDYLYSIVLHKKELSQLLSRLMLFNDGTKNYGKFDFSKDEVVISDWSSDNKESIKYTNECPTLESYTALLNTDNLSMIINGCDTEYITLCFGDGRAFSCVQPTITDIIPEIKQQG